MTRLLVYSATRGYRHASIPDGVAAVHELGTADGFEVDATEDGSAFTPANLGRYAAVVFMNTSGDVLDDAGRAALTAFVAAGGGYVGVHLASGTEYDWPYYGRLVGARFDQHPAVQEATFVVEDRTHPATGHLPSRWTRVDELYNYRANPRADVRVLMTLDESSYSGGTMGADHPITWCHRYLGGPAFYTGAGHTPESYAEPEFRQLLLGGLRYAAGTVRVDDRPEVGFVPVGGPEDVDGWAGQWSGGVKFGWCSPDGRRPEVRLGGREVPLDGADLDGAVNPPGEWNTTELAVDGGRLVGYLNGEKVLDLDSDGWHGELSVTDAALRRIRWTADRAGSVQSRPGA
jgi:type 1 glutamine amidotransferase